MKLFKSFAVVIFLLIITRIDGQVEEWKEPYFEPSSDVQDFEHQFKKVTFRFNENVPANTVLGHIIKKNDIKPDLRPSNNKFFKLEEVNGIHALKNVEEIDYELISEVKFTIVVGTIVVNFIVSINNLNDNPMVIFIPQKPCEIMENITPPLKTDCFYEISDRDGISEEIDISKISDHTQFFEMAWEGNYIGEKTATVFLHTKEQLDYEKNQVFLFTWTVTDESEFNATASVIINVDDAPDMPPKWTKVLAIEQFKEHDDKIFKVAAIDGDIKIKDNITYACTSIPPKVEKYISCEWCAEEYGDYCIRVKNLDRDEYDINSVMFEIIATEKSHPNLNTSQDVTLIIDDINDNVPIITVTEHFIEIEENKYTNLDNHIEISISDIDLAENARYNVVLKCLVENFTSAIQIVPALGYQKGDFSLTIINAALLDYDRNEDIRDFTFEIVPSETASSSCNLIPPKKQIRMKLKNWNDELPIFQEENYRVTIKETFGRKGPENLLIDNLYALDDDFGDSVSYELLGSAIMSILELENHIPAKPNDNVIIKTIKQTTEKVQLFDYERNHEVIIQLKAIDNFPNSQITNTATAQITIKLEDVNDETPTILITDQSTSLKENVNDGTTIKNINNDTIKITVFDEDSEPELNVFIDWDGSNPTKNGQKIAWGEYINSITVEKVVNGEYILKTKEVVSKNTPDFEQFDTMNLKIVVEDKKQEVNDGFASLMFVINVINDNDCPPKFEQVTIESNKTVMEHSIPGTTTISTIRAKDEDLDAEIKYSIISGKFQELVELDEETGEITVKGDIDADLPIYALNFTVRAFDGRFEDTADIQIKVIDINDEKPVFQEKILDTSIKEESEVGFVVKEKVLTYDKDREYPNNAIEYFLSNDADINKYFAIDKSTGRITVKDAGLDRGTEKEPKSYEIIVNIKDNPSNVGAENTNSSSFKITLIDINNKYPIIDTQDLPPIDEQVKQGEEIGVIIAHDDDEEGNDNSKIKFKILNVINRYPDGVQKELGAADFKISTDEEHITGKGTITANIDLRDCYGEYFLEIMTEDFGVPSKSDRKNISLTIKKFNFESPIFTFPSDEDVISLLPGQSEQKPLTTSLGIELQPFEAKSDPKGKYKVDIELKDPTNTFGLKPKQSKYDLVYENVPDETKTYELILTAIDDGEPQGSTEIKIKIAFLDKEIEPSYSNNNISVYFNELAYEEEVPTALADVNSEGITVHYFLHHDPYKAFSVDESTGDLTILEKFVRENFTDPYIIISATKETTPPVNPNFESTLNVMVELQSVNYRPPYFLRENFFGGIMTSYEIGKKVLTIQGQDKDENDTLSYRILEETFTAVGVGITSDHTFKLTQISNEEAVILIEFKVQSNMDGYFIFDVEVSDTLHIGKATVKIIIISQTLHMVELKFENEINDVLKNEKEIPEIITGVVGETCVVDEIVKGTDENGFPTDFSTQVRMHFIRGDSIIDSNEMIGKIIDLSNYAKLRSEFVKRSLIISTVAQTQTTQEIADDNSLLTWLISVSVVLGTLCIILIVAFVLKTRSLMTRINRLSTTKFESMASNLNVTAVPTSNRNAVEGSNPIYQLNGQNKIEFDRESISSGESDLIGIENNPTFATK